MDAAAIETRTQPRKRESLVKMIPSKVKIVLALDGATAEDVGAVEMQLMTRDKTLIQVETHAVVVAANAQKTRTTIPLRQPNQTPMQRTRRKTKTMIVRP